MITHSDSEYRATKRLKLGAARLAPPFDEMGAWVSATWHVTVLNVIYDPKSDHLAPRLQVILEHESDARTFSDGVNFEESKQQAIAAHFRELVRSQPSRYETQGMFVVLSAFAPIAKQEADSRISDEDVKALQARIGDPHLWCISRCFGRVTFMFYTDEQIVERQADGSKDSYARSYFAMLKGYDEFGYLTIDNFSIAFDSKENFDRNYQGSWFYYYR